MASGDSIAIGPATDDQLDDLVELSGLLFEEDAAQYDRLVDLGWAAREGRADLLGLMDSPAGLVLAAAIDGRAVGLLVGYHQETSSTRHAFRFAVLRSLYVRSGHRRVGLAKQLVDEFVAWTRAEHCAEVHVSSYSENEPAQKLYQRLGFAPRSLTRVLDL